MSITDELRKWASVEVPYKYGHQLAAIADRIDAEYQKAIRELNNLADASVLLPVDADGEPIHIEDVMEYPNGGREEVRFMTLNGAGWLVNEAGWLPVQLHHHHAPTVEDVLREMLDAWGELPSNVTNEAIIAEYAKRLTLAEGEDA